MSELREQFEKEMRVFDEYGIFYSVSDSAGQVEISESGYKDLYIGWLERLHEQKDNAAATYRRAAFATLKEKQAEIQEHNRFIQYTNISGKWDAWKRFNKVMQDDDGILVRTENIESEPFENDKPVESKGLDDMNI